MIRRPRLALIAALACLADGCTASPTDPWPNVVIEVTRSRFYPDDHSAVLDFEVANLSADITYYLAACAEQPLISVDRRQGTQWLDPTGTVCIAILSMVPISLAPGQSTQFSRGVRILAPGVYRLRLGVSRRPSDAVDWTEASNAFQLR